MFKGLFKLGDIIASQDALKVLSGDDMVSAVRRHASGDWGQVDPHIAAENQLSLTSPGTLLSKFSNEQGYTFYVKTLSVLGQMATSLLLPSELLQ